LIRNTEKAINRSRQAIAGVKKHFAAVPTLALDGTAMTPDDVTAELQAAIDAADAAASVEKAFHDAVAAKHAAFAKTTARLRSLKALVQNQLGNSEEVLGDFGFSNTKPRTPDEATKAAAVAKRAATRAARHTMGKRQKAPIKGAVAAAVPSRS
jgi:hypothetical protein